jgi:hypothetical protein
MHVETLGSGQRVVLVHGSGGNSGWPAQRPLAERYTLVMPTRSGYPPNPPLERICLLPEMPSTRSAGGSPPGLSL